VLFFLPTISFVSLFINFPLAVAWSFQFHFQVLTVTNPPFATLTRLDSVLCILMLGLATQVYVFPCIIRERVFHAGGVVLLLIYVTVWSCTFGKSDCFLDICQITVRVHHIWI